MRPVPDHGEESYRGSGRLAGKVALITGGDSGIGRAVAIAYARDGADVAISYLQAWGTDAEATARFVREAGCEVLLLPGDISSVEHSRSLVARMIERFGRLDVLVTNGAYQKTREFLDEIDEAEWDQHFAADISAMFYITKAAVPHLPAGCDPQHLVGERQAPGAEPAGLLRHPGCHRQLHAGLGADAGAKRASG